MTLLARAVVLIPLGLSITAFVLSALSLFAGHKQGFMEDYAIARLNVSRIGYDLLQSDSGSDQNQDDDGDNSFWDSIKDTWDDAKDTVMDEINDLVGDVAGEIADTIGISEWYSLHVMDACEGNYSPNSTAEGASLNITDCTGSQAGFRLNITAMMDKELSVGPFDLNPADLGWDEKIQDKLDIINDALLGLFVLYVLSMGFTGLAVLGCLAAVVLVDSKLLVLVNMLTSALATLCLIIGSILITVVLTKGVNEINDIAEEIGVHVARGDKFLAITWAAAAVMIAPVVFWAVRFFVMRREKKLNRHSKESY